MRNIIFPFLFIGSMAMAFIVTKTGATLNTEKTPHGILDLELAYSVSKVETVINAWTPSDINPINNIAVAKTNTWWDFVFLIFYAPFLFTLCKKISRSYKTNSLVSKAGNLFANAILIAGMLDVVENIGIFQSLNGNIGHGIALLTASASLIKWMLVIGCLLFILVSFPKAIYLHRKVKS